jgi:glycosyltransferase involved in cell wall biosynthesis
MMAINIVSMLVLSFQIFYCGVSIYHCLNTKTTSIRSNKVELNKISVIIPLYNSEKTIEQCLQSILKGNSKYVREIIIINDNSIDNSLGVVRKVRESRIPIFVINQEITQSGKSAALLLGIQTALSNQVAEEVVLLDADIVLKANAIENLLRFHKIEGNFYTSGLIYPYPSYKGYREQSIVMDRIYRQSVLQRVRSKFAVSNFPGGIGIVNISKYSRHLKTGFLEDLTATYKVLSNNEYISILDKVIAYEIERNSYKGVYLQRVRWTAGNLQNISGLLKSLFRAKGMVKKYLILSYPIMWYVQHYLIFLGIFLIVTYKTNFYLFVNFVLYFIQIIIANNTFAEEKAISFPGVIIHIIVFPIIISMALVEGIFQVIRHRSFFFREPKFYSRS